MMLDADIKAQLAQYLEMMEGDVLLKISAGSDEVSLDMVALVDELATMSSHIKVEKAELERTPSFSVNRVDEDTGIVFAVISLGHEFTSLVLALLPISSRAPRVDEKVSQQVKDLEGTYHFESFISLSCQNCPEVVQARNLMRLLKANITIAMGD